MKNFSVIFDIQNGSLKRVPSKKHRRYRITTRCYLYESRDSVVMCVCVFFFNFVFASDSRSFIQLQMEHEKQCGIEKKPSRNLSSFTCRHDATTV